MVGTKIFDTSVFLAISWRLSSDSMEGTTLREKVSLFCSRTGHFRHYHEACSKVGKLIICEESKVTVDQTLITSIRSISVLGHVAGIVMLLAPSVLPFDLAILTTPVAALMNAMGCRAFRVIKIRDYREDSSVPLPFTARPENSISPSRMRKGGDPQLGVHLCDGKGQPLSRIVFNPEVAESSQADLSGIPRARFTRSDRL